MDVGPEQVWIFRERGWEEASGVSIVVDRHGSGGGRRGLGDGGLGVDFYSADGFVVG